MKSSEKSPLVETIEVSESLIKGGCTDMVSDISYTPSEWRNGKHYIMLNYIDSVLNHWARC